MFAPLPYHSGLTAQPRRGYICLNFAGFLSEHKNNNKNFGYDKAQRGDSLWRLKPSV